jgi:hypothetical protein
LSKFRGLMIRVKNGAVIGRETRFFGMCPVTISRMWFFSANHSAVFNPDHQTTEFRQTTVSTTLVDPSHQSLGIGA